MPGTITMPGPARRSCRRCPGLAVMVTSDRLCLVRRAKCRHLFGLSTQNRCPKPADCVKCRHMDGNTLPNLTLAERLFRELGEAIVRGDLAPGSKISEPSLARRYGVSRGPLREALHRLQERKLITRSANQGARVVQLSAQGLAEIFTVREALEGIAAREAATKATPEEREALTQALLRHRAELPGTDGPNRPKLTANRDFHFL